jgi:hypothetical protein
VADVEAVEVPDRHHRAPQRPAKRLTSRYDPHPLDSRPCRPCPATWRPDSCAPSWARS